MLLIYIKIWNTTTLFVVIIPNNSGVVGEQAIFTTLSSIPYFET